MEVSALNSRLLKLETVRDVYARRAVELTNRIDEAQRFVDLAPKIEEVLQRVQGTVYEQVAGKMERLLTALLYDVFPDKEGIERVEFQVETKRQDTTLNILLRKREGDEEFPEDIFDGKGGSIANIVVAGLRIIALARSPQMRPFVVFDEPDCWMKQERAKPFFKVLKQVVEQLGFQAVLITHHPVEDLMGDHPAIIELSLNNPQDKEIQIAVPPSFPKWESDQRGVREIRLKNVMTWKDVTLPLAPGLTVLSGDNDIGKSGLGVALRAVLRGESGEHLIRHRAKKAEVVIDLGPEGKIEWVRERKRSRAVWWRYYDANGELKHEQNLSSLPEWIEELGFKAFRPKKGGVVIDPQLAHQKRPAFILDSTGSERAAILSVGRETVRLNQMFGIFRQKLRECKRTVREAKKELKTVNALLETLTVLHPLREQVNEAQNLKEKVEVFGKMKDEGAEMVKKIRLLTESQKVRNALQHKGELEGMKADVRNAAEKVRAVENGVNVVTQLNRLGQSVSVLNEAFATISAIPNVSSSEIRTRLDLLEEGVTVCEKVQGLSHLSQVRTEVSRVSEQLEKSSLGELVNPEAFTRREKAVAYFDEIKKAIEDAKSLKNVAARELRLAEQELKELREQAGEVCPFCAQPMPSASDHTSKNRRAEVCSCAAEPFV